MDILHIAGRIPSGSGHSTQVGYHQAVNILHITGRIPSGSAEATDVSGSFLGCPVRHLIAREADMCRHPLEADLCTTGDQLVPDRYDLH